MIYFLFIDYCCTVICIEFPSIQLFLKTKLQKMTDRIQEVRERQSERARKRESERETEEPVPFSLTVKAQLTKSDSCQLLDNWGQLEEK